MLNDQGSVAYCVTCLGLMPTQRAILTNRTRSFHFDRHVRRGQTLLVVAATSKNAFEALVDWIDDTKAARESGVAEDKTGEARQFQRKSQLLHRFRGTGELGWLPRAPGNGPHRRRGHRVRLTRSKRAARKRASQRTGRTGRGDLGLGRRRGTGRAERRWRTITRSVSPSPAPARLGRLQLGRLRQRKSRIQFSEENH